jgi:hypothetical protein
MKILISFLAVGLLLTWSGKSNCWRGLTPLYSTCADVKRALQVDSCPTPLSNYTLPDFQVMIEFKNASCDSEPRGWRVSPSTITAITLTPRKEMLPSQFGLDLSKYEVRDDDEIVGAVHYESRQEGVTAILYRGFVQTLYLYPRANDEKLRCKPFKSQ